MRPIKSSDVPWYNGHGFYVFEKPVPNPNYKPEMVNEPVQSKFLSVKEMMTATQFRLETHSDDEINNVINEFRNKSNPTIEPTPKPTPEPTPDPVPGPIRDH